ncbi:MAG: sugar fermentation stimulation protein SfsA [Candidatus Margulisbacteria bacterium GWF2_35_9]|nr:MAG: sugar fermentation stimulation protein SfsA [Candidatus Margulisbacteria bacterium GWF2_35_9]
MLSVIFQPPLIAAIFLRRYKRFLADVVLQNGEEVTILCPNTGSMKTCLGEGWPAMISIAKNPDRKTKYTLEMVHNQVCWIGLNTQLANQIVVEAIQEGKIAEISPSQYLRTEVKYGQNSRIDILIDDPKQKTYIEIKTVTLLEDNTYMFPDAVTTRGHKHLKELVNMVKDGHRAINFFLVLRSDGNLFKPAEHIDPEYARLLNLARNQGVEILAYGTDIFPEQINVNVPVQISL